MTKEAISYNYSIFSGNLWVKTIPSCQTQRHACSLFMHSPMYEHSVIVLCVCVCMCVHGASVECMSACFGSLPVHSFIASVITFVYKTRL